MLISLIIILSTVCESGVSMDNLLGERIKYLREERQLNQIELAKYLKISNTTLSQYEAGNRTPSDDIKIQIANYFNVSMDYLLGRTDDRNYADTSINSDWPPEAKVLFRDVHKLTPEQRDIVLKLIKEFIGESK